jgi:uncharacterized cupredoxin-like copper-binding protein
MFTRIRNLIALGVVSLLIVPLVAACSSAGAAGNSGTIDVTETDYKIQLSSSTAPAGTVTFHITNKAPDMTHEFIVIQTDTPAGKLPLDSSGLVDTAKAGKDMGSVKDLQAGATKDLTLDLTAGHYALICNLPGHYQLGMYADFTVK